MYFQILCFFYLGNWSGEYCRNVVINTVRSSVFTATVNGILDIGANSIG